MTIRKLLAVWACTLAAGSAQAQLRLPQVQLPPLAEPAAGLLRDNTQRLLDTAPLPDLRSLRLEQVTGLLRRHRDALEADPRGEPMVRREILAWWPTPAGLAAAASVGLVVAGRQGEDVVLLRVPDALATAEALERLRALDPAGAYDFNHIYTGSGGEQRESLGEVSARQGAGQAAARGSAGLVDARVGLIDSGIERGHEVFGDAAIVRWGCDGAYFPNAHGTAVAALMVGRSARFSGAAPGATLYAADIYCDNATGGSAARIVAALGWLARERVPVINLSLVGPANQIMERVVRGMVQRGHLLVAAVGNDGPAAPPLYPASYPGVVGVTGVDKRGRTLPEAARGPQVMFGAPGSQMVSAAIGAQPYRVVRGTSFASPIVAALLAGEMERPAPEAAMQALARLGKAAVAAEDAGRGVLGTSFRIDPATLR